MNYKKEPGRLEDENVIIDLIQITEPAETYFVTNSKTEHYIYKAIMKEWDVWTLNNGHDRPPPDFYSEAHKLMFDVMRINDSERQIVTTKGKTKKKNPILAKEARIMQEIKAAFPDVENRNIFINVMPDGNFDESHNYKQYCEHANRVFDSHIKSIPLCRHLHPTFKMGFLVMDETESYFMHQNIIDAYAAFDPNKQYLVNGYPHIPINDRRIMQTLLDNDIDFVIWYMPYKHREGSPLQPPKLVFYDLCCKKVEMKMRDYPSYLLRRM